MTWASEASPTAKAASRRLRTALGNDGPILAWLLLPAAIVFTAFFLLPLGNLFLIGGSGARGWGAYTAVLTDPQYLRSLVSTVALAAATTVATLFVSGITGVFLTVCWLRG